MGAWSHCQAIAKQQQAAEKSVRALVAALREAGFTTMPTRRTHDVEAEISALRRIPFRGDADSRDVGSRLNHLLSEHRCAEIRALCALAPKWPAPGWLFPKNTEYPYQDRDGSWRAPADPGSFRRSDVDRFRNLTKRLVLEVTRLVSAVQRIST